MKLLLDKEVANTNIGEKYVKSHSIIVAMVTQEGMGKLGMEA